MDDQGLPTGRTELVHSGEGGITGYLVWLGKNNPAAYAPLLARVLPLQVNQKVEHALDDGGAAPRQRRAADSVAQRQGKPSLPLTYGLRLISHN